MRQYITKITILLALLLLLGTSVQTSSKEIHSSMDVVNISVEEAWSFLSDTSNGIQIPIDVRTDDEWQADRIDTPYPEYPRHYSINDLQNSAIRAEFLERYSGYDIIVYCKSGGRSSSASSLLSSSGFNGTVYNMLGGITAWKGAGYPSKSGNIPPSTPQTPTGDTVCTINQSGFYTTVAIDPNDDILKYGWDWDNDMNIDEWTEYVPSGESIEIVHTWQHPGTVQIQVICEDLVGEQSDFSEPFTIFINQPPDTPMITGETNGRAGEQYSYNIQSSDPEDQMISYDIDWGDGSNSTIGPYTSETGITINHTWSEKDSYIIKVKARDEYGAESEWQSLEVSMPQGTIYHYIQTWFNHHFYYMFDLFHMVP